MNTEVNLSDLDDMLAVIWERQLELQKRLGFDFMDMSMNEVIDYIRWSSVAVTSELAEAIGEVGWKPWATSKHINRNAFVGECIDIWKFVLNMMLSVGVTPGEFFEVFMAKTAVNHDRINNGYDGVSDKCGECGRAQDEPHSAA